MAKKILGLMSVLLVLLMVALFFSQNEKVEHLNSGEKVKQKATNNKSQDKVSKKQLAELPDVSVKDWQLVLVNGTHPISKEPKKLTSMKNGYEIDPRVYDFYYQMEEAALKAGHSLTVISSYRSISQQQEVYDNGIKEQLAAGHDQKTAEEKTVEYITIPGTSEHHTGLAVDVVEQDWYAQGKGLEEEFCDTPAGKWIEKNAPTHGFIVRYPREKEKLTGINYEPWHLRYVGKESAEYITKHKLALEEYIDLLEKAGK